MPYSTVLYERISELLPHAPYKRMFGGVVFFGRGHMLVGVFGEGMMVRVGADAFDEALAQAGVRPLASQRANMNPDIPAEQRLLRLHRKRIETCNSQLEKMGVARLHTRIVAGVSLKIAASLCALSVSKYRLTSNQSCFIINIIT